MKEVINGLTILLKAAVYLDEIGNRVKDLENEIFKMKNPMVSGNSVSEFHGERRLTPEEGDLIRGAFKHIEKVVPTVTRDMLTTFLVEALSVNRKQIGSARSYLSGRFKKRLKRSIPPPRRVKEWLAEIGIA